MVTQLPASVPDPLRRAFWRYDAALLNNEQETLNALFAPGSETIRGDGSGLLVGHAAIAGFRSGRSRIPTRQIVAVHATVLGDDAVLLLARTRDGAATGLQTQLWQRIGDEWLITAAHVSAPAAPAVLDTTVWRAAGDPLVAAARPGPLSGLGVAVKDLFAVAGQPVGAGVPEWLAQQPIQQESAPVVQALLESGAHIVGIARADEFAYSLAGANVHYGTPPNPAAPESVSGGSSSGPASAVALRQAEVGLGTDTGGSIRVPASYQGLVGMARSARRVSCRWRRRSTPSAG
jgi:hypothetical protein